MTTSLRLNFVTHCCYLRGLLTDEISVRIILWLIDDVACASEQFDTPMDSQTQAIGQEELGRILCQYQY